MILCKKIFTKMKIPKKKFFCFFPSIPDIPFFLLFFPQLNEACEKTIAREIDPERGIIRKKKKKGINKPPFPIRERPCWKKCSRTLPFFPTEGGVPRKWDTLALANQRYGAM